MSRQTIGLMTLFLCISAGWAVSLAMHWLFPAWWMAGLSAFVVVCCVMGAFHIGKADGIRDTVDRIRPQINVMEALIRCERARVESEIALNRMRKRGTI